MLLGILATGCGGPDGARGQAHSGPYSNERDPSTYRPAPTTEAATGDTFGVRLADANRRARDVALAFLEATFECDQERLVTLVADPLVRVVAGSPPISVTAQELIANIVEQVSPLSRENAGSVEEWIDPLSIQVEPAGGRLGKSLGVGDDAINDRVVVFTLRHAHRNVFARALGWASQGHVVVRPGPTYRVIGF